jgi:hypothetical protein
MRVVAATLGVLLVADQLLLRRFRSVSRLSGG